MAQPLHSIRFPGETDEYRQARDQLLQQEIALRHQLETVAALRRELPLGGAIKEDYVFEEGATNLADLTTRQSVQLSALFGPGKDSLILYSFMYGPEMNHACPSCTSILDGLNGSAPHVAQRANLAVVAKSPLERIRSFAQQRGWTHLRLLSSAHNSYNTDYHGETADGHQIPALNVFVRRHGQIYHFYNAELLFSKSEPGQDPRHADLIWPLWNLLDLTPEGRGDNWQPKLTY